jgi:thioesterase domain-containing protein
MRMQQAHLDHLDRALAAMPPVAAMAIRVAGYEGTRLRLRAPLAANVNDKDCAFGGSLASLMTLAGWGWLTLKCAEAGVAAEVYVADSHLRYLAPVYADLEADAGLGEGEDWPAVLRCLAERGRARVHMQAQVPGADGAPAATLKARYALKRA